MKLLTSIAFILLACSSSTLLAQNFSGEVRDERQLPIAGAHVLNITSGEHAHSNRHGYFTLPNANLGDTLNVMCIGYQKVVVAIDDIDSRLIVQLDEKSITIEEVVISPEINALNLITDIDVELQPVKSSQDLLRRVPGLMIGQHAGGGKAEQIFLRGFDIDHGTDVNISVDELPVNMVSHAHGQGYADMHFVIPETLEGLNFEKGPYSPDKGNFATAGHVSFNTYKRLQSSQLKIEAGQFNSQRAVGLVNVLSTPHHSAYIAGEFIHTDGPFESPQDFTRANIFAKYTGALSKNKELSVSLSHFDSRWNASGQIPLRAVNDSSITRFGAIDDTEGGSTSRQNAVLSLTNYMGEDAYIKSTFYYSHYQFDLFSNFTFFLMDSLNGDQIRQKENRDLAGITTEYFKALNNKWLKGNVKAGLNLRKDVVRENELSHTLNRLDVLEAIQFGDVHETNAGGFVSLTSNYGKWLVNPSLRLDYFHFDYRNRLGEQKRETDFASLFSPKLNVLYNFNHHLQGYLKLGKGFHSNDTRVVLSNSVQKAIPAAYGSDVGFIWKPIHQVILSAAYWHLFLEQEFVYVGDAGIVEPSGQTRRQGLDIGARVQVKSWLFANADINYAFARALTSEKEGIYIPLAPDLSATMGITAIFESGFNFGINMRHLNDRPANEFYTIVAEGYTIIDFTTSYTWKQLTAGIRIENLLNSAWNETQFATESRLQHETIPVEEIHFTPGTPFFAKGSLTYKF